MLSGLFKRENIRTSEDRAALDVILENIPVGLTWVGPDLIFRAANRKHAELFGVPWELAKPGSSIVELWRFLAERGDYGDLKTEEAINQKLDELGARHTGTEHFFYERPIGNSKVITIEGRPVQGGGIVCIFTDVTELKNKERALEKSGERFEKVNVAIDNALESALAGDFTKRIDSAHDDEKLNALCDNVNALLAEVDNGLSEVGSVLNALAGGDLANTVQGEYQGAFQTLKNNTNHTVERLREITGQIADASDSLQVFQSNLSTGFNDLATRTEFQASSMEETTAAMEELSTTVRQNASNAAEANKL